MVPEGMTKTSKKMLGMVHTQGLVCIREELIEGKGLQILTVNSQRNEAVVKPTWNALPIF